MLSAVGWHEVGQLQKGVSIITKGRNALSNRMDHQFSRVVNRITIVKQSSFSTFIPATTAQVPKERRKLDKKDSYLSDTNSSFLKDSSQSQFKGEPRLSGRVS